MRTELAKIWHLRQKQLTMESSATSISSPGFEPHYGGSGKKCAPYEADIIAACDMQEEIDDAVRVYIQSMEDDNREILSKTTGQRQRVLRLWTIARKSVEDIATILGISRWTVERRLSDIVPEKTYASEFERVFFETRLMRVDAQIEEYFAYAYKSVEDYVECVYDEAEDLIEAHKTKAKAIRAEHDRRADAIRSAINVLDGRNKRVVMGHLAGNEEWEDIGAAIGVSGRQAKRIYADVVRKIPMSLVLA